MNTPLVLIHGFPLDATMWEPQVAALTQRGYRVLPVNLPGFGGAPNAPWPKERCSIEAFAEHVHEFIVREAGGKAIVGGFSMGGYVLMALLENHPESVRAAMLFDTRPEADSAEARAARLASMGNIQATGSLAALVDTMVPRLVSPHSPPELRHHVRSMILRQNAQAVACAQYAMSRRPDRTALLSTLKLPALLVVGADDVITPPSVAIAMHSHMPHAMLTQVVKAGHLANLEAPTAVNASIETFLQTF